MCDTVYVCKKKKMSISFQRNVGIFKYLDIYLKDIPDLKVFNMILIMNVNNCYRMVCISILRASTNNTFHFFV